MTHVAQLRFGHTASLQRYEANRKAGRVEADDNRRQCARWHAALLRGSEIRDGGDGRIRIGARLKIHLDDARARQRPRLNMLNAGSKGKETFLPFGDVLFHLLGRHTRIKRRDAHHRQIQCREHIHGHADQRERT